MRSTSTTNVVQTPTSDETCGGKNDDKRARRRKRLYFRLSRSAKTFRRPSTKPRKRASPPASMRRNSSSWTMSRRVNYSLPIVSHMRIAYNLSLRYCIRNSEGGRILLLHREGLGEAIPKTKSANPSRTYSIQHTRSRTSLLQGSQGIPDSRGPNFYLRQDCRQGKKTSLIRAHPASNREHPANPPTSVS